MHSVIAVGCAARRRQQSRYSKHTCGMQLCLAKCRMALCALLHNPHQCPLFLRNHSHRSFESQICKAQARAVVNLHTTQLQVSQRRSIGLGNHLMS